MRLLLPAATALVLSGFANGLPAAHLEETRVLEGLVLGLSPALWVSVWVREQGYRPAFEYRAFLFFGWPLILPYYLIRLNGWRGLLATFGLVFSYVFFNVVGWGLGVYAARVLRKWLLSPYTQAT